VEEIICPLRFGGKHPLKNQRRGNFLEWALFATIKRGDFERAPEIELRSWSGTKDFRGAKGAAHKKKEPSLQPKRGRIRKV